MRSTERTSKSCDLSSFARMTAVTLCKQVPSGGRCQLDGLLDVFATEPGALDKAPEESGALATMVFRLNTTTMPARRSMPAKMSRTTDSRETIFQRPLSFRPHKTRPARSATMSSIIGVGKKVGCTLPTPTCYCALRLRGIYNRRPAVMIAATLLFG